MPATNKRTKTDPHWLAAGIRDQIKSRKVVLAGVREYQVHQGLDMYGATVHVIELWAPENERYARVLKNGKVSSYKDFVKHGDAELRIGLEGLMLSHYPTFVTTYNTPEDTLEEILNRVEGQLCQ